MNSKEKMRTKKNVHFKVNYGKIIRLSINSLFIMLLFVSNMAFSQAIGQNKNITLSFKNAELLTVLNDIEKKSDFVFMYDPKKLDVKQKVSIEVSNTALNSVLKQIFDGIGVDFAINGKQIALSNSVNQSKIKTVSGKVLDSNGLPVIGASIFVKGSKEGTITNIDGEYYIQNLSADAKLVFSYIGMQTQEVDLRGRNVLNITLDDQAELLQEVVAIGYGTAKKANLTGSVSNVKFGESLESRPMTNISTALAGKASGVYIKQNSGQPGNDGSDILIRGLGTLNDSRPLILIDGVEGNLGDVNSNDVESITVLKDASSAAIYGSRAANGVVLVTTKGGDKDNVRISYNGYGAMSNPTNRIKLITDYPTHMELINEAHVNMGLGTRYDQYIIDEWREQSKVDPLLYPNTDWYQVMFKPAYSQSHNISASGGNNKTNYLISLGILDDQSIMEKTDFRRYSARVKIDTKINDFITIGANIFGNYSDRQIGNATNVFDQIDMTVPGILPVYPDGRFGGPMAVGESTNANNPLAALATQNGNENKQKLISNFQFKVDFSKNLQWETNFATELGNTLNERSNNFVDIWNFQSNSVLKTLGGLRTYVNNQYNRDFATTLNSVLRWNKQFGVHNTSALVGVSQEYSKNSFFVAQKYDLIDPALPVLGAAAADPTASGSWSDRAIRSLFSRVNYVYLDKYLLEANIRYDGSSRFSEESRWGIFPSFSAGWRASEESFIQELGVFDNLKVRGSWGQLGNNRIGDYEYQSLYTSTPTVLNGAIVTGVAAGSGSNSKLKWEKTTITDIGLDVSVLKNRLSLEFDYFYKLTSDILINIPTPLVIGLSSPNQNVGIVLNKGYDINLVWRDKIGKDFSYGASVNYSNFSSIVQKYKGEVNSYSGNKILGEGMPIWSYYLRRVDHIAQTQEEIDLMIADGYQFVGTTPKPGDFIYKDLNGDKIINNDDREVVGSSVPTSVYGLSLDAAYKGFDLSLVFQGTGGIDYYLGGITNTTNLTFGYSIQEKFLDRWTPENPSTTMPRLTANSPSSRNNFPNDHWLQDASYIRLKNIQLGYKVPASLIKKLNIKDMRFFMSAENYLTFTKFEGLDPEILSTSFPTLKKLSIGLNFSL